VPFPLPDGYCRNVCRPNRKFPRRFKLSDAVRIAVAAVENGEDACVLARAVRAAVGCTNEKCAEAWLDFDNGVQAAEEDLAAVSDAVMELLEALGLPPEEDKVETIARRLLRILRSLILVYEIANAIANLIIAVGALALTVRRLIESARGLANCIGSEQ